MARGLSKAAGGVLSYFTRHKTAANLILILVLMAGLYAIPKMRAQFFPDIVVDDITVQVQWDGAGAEDVDLAIVQVLEPALQSVDGVIATTSRSREGSASISLEFEPGWDMEQAQSDVDTALDGAQNLPESAEDPDVVQSRGSDRVTAVVISGPVGVAQVATCADDFGARR
ncbi:MAG: efflux RND transporter permease subunit, partial [Boseongicola sp.]|nr:efflux RND transporter permease subunit [Boseongicola sp.]